MSWKRLLFLFHRWAGIVLCLFFALWFVSGLFMMYVEFPQLTAPERRVGEPELKFNTAPLSPGDAVARLTEHDFSVVGTPSQNQSIAEYLLTTAVSVREIQLGMLLDRPVYRIYADNGAQPCAVYADNGEVLRVVTPAMAESVASEFARRSDWLPRDTASIRYRGLVQTDQWTVSSALNAHRPLHRFSISEDSGIDLYVSSTTGEVVRDTHRIERGLNYFGAVTHWIYPTFIRRFPEAWEWMIDVLAGAGGLLALSGLWIGVLRWRRTRRPGQSRVPYRGLLRWHYWTGLVFGVPALTWVFSGLLSMNPGNLNPSRSPSRNEVLVFAGKPLSLEDFEPPSTAALGDGAVEARLLHYSGQPFYAVTARNGAVRLAPADSRTNLHLPNTQALISRSSELMPHAGLAGAYLLTQYDDYYYTRHPERGEKHLPVLRLQFQDDERTWFHVDPITAEILDRSTRLNRAYRWLYNGLHSWDIRWLWERRPLWDIAVISFSLGGILLSVIGLVAGMRRLRREL